MRRRGPDDNGHVLYPMGAAAVGLGHTRLSIIDLSAAGHQPMHSADGRWAIVFNGEIYNYRELRDELRILGHQFVSDSDTEVLLAAWAQWGAAVLPRLTGMFAFALLDKERGQLTCARDAFGIKPFFYAADRPGFVFASELPALLRLLPGKPELNWQRAYREKSVICHSAQVKPTVYSRLSSPFLLVPLRRIGENHPFRSLLPTLPTDSPRIIHVRTLAIQRR